MLHLTFHSISPGFILLTIGLWVGDAANVLRPVNIAGVFKGRQFFKREARPTFEAAIVILVGAGGGCWIGKRLILNKKGPCADER